MHSNNLFLNFVSGVKRLCQVRGENKCSQQVRSESIRTVDEQFERMIGKCETSIAGLKPAIEKLRNSESFEDASREAKMEKQIAYLEELKAILEFLQKNFRQNYMGVVNYNFEEVLWPLAVKMTIRNFGSDEESKEFLDETHLLYRLVVDAAKQRYAQNQNQTPGTRGGQQGSLKKGAERKVCNTCGELMGQCEKCDAWIKPCLLSMGMVHVCD